MFLRILICSICVMSSALSQDGQVSQDLKWGAISEGCRISLTSDKEQYNFGDPINLHVVLQNVDRKELRIFEGAHFPYRIEMYLPNNEDGTLTLWGHTQTRAEIAASNIRIILMQGQTQADDFITLNRAYDMSLDGKYAIVAHRIVPSETDPKAWVDVVSNPIVIEIKTQLPK
jgi:hypothetical protein